MNRAEEKKIHQYGLLYEMYAPSLLFYARKFVPYPAAEDIVHDLFLKLWEKPFELAKDDATASYLFTSVHNACINQYKKEAIHKTYVERAIFELKLEELNYYSPEKGLIRQEQIQAIHSAIEALPPKSREVFRLAYIEGKTPAEIAELTNTSRRTVENQLYKSLVRLKKELLAVLIALLKSMPLN